MNSPNPYEAPASSQSLEPALPAKRVSLQRFLPVHFIYFLAVFLLGFALILFISQGAENTIRILGTSPRKIVEIFFVALAAWLGHALVASSLQRVRSIGAIPSAVIGALFFIVGLVTFEIAPKPAWLMQSLAPLYVFRAFYFGFAFVTSVASVALVAMCFGKSSTKIGDITM